MPIRLAKMNTVITEGPPPSRMLLSKMNTVITEGPPPSVILLSKTNTVITEGPFGRHPEGRRRSGFGDFVP
jgi:hypothetical protein